MLAVHPPETSAALHVREGKPPAWFGAFAEGEAAGFRHLLILRFAVLNLVALALLGAAWMKGWVALLLDGDSTRLVALIAVVFLAGLLECARRLWQTSVELDQLAAAGPAPSPSADSPARAVAASVLRMRLAARIAPIRHIAGSLVFLGLIGTVIGFIIALSAVDLSVAGDVSAIGPMVSTLIGGMSVALYTTLVGAILNVWLMVNYRLLESGTVSLLAALVERGERHA